MAAKTKRLQRTTKRLLDVIGAAVGLIFFFPSIMLAALAVYLRMGLPVFFRHVRPGLHERPFVLYKLCTMTDAMGLDGKLLPDGERLTGLGRFLRRWSLDELPQLWNVMKGDMSLVGPRPLLMEYLDRYTPEQRRRHEVKPGITGWAQIKGRNSLSWQEKLDFDVWYVDNWGFWFDLKMLVLTVRKVLRREGISQRGQATMETFMGLQTPRSTKETDTK